MFNIKFRHADPSRRTPTFLQAHTIENLVWQLLMLPVVLIGINLWGKWEDKKLEQRYQKKSTTS